MPATSWRYVLGSRSPRRQELLAQIVPRESIEIVPPQSADEAGFDDVHTWTEIEERLRSIARTKCHDVCRQVADRFDDDARGIVLAADTTIVASEADGQLTVLGQPPNNETWEATVRRWFRDYYAGRTHVAMTGLCVRTFDGREVEQLVKTEVTFSPDAERWVDWYLATQESRGKAGGYALQGAGSVFVTSVQGSISNVIGLPLREVLDILVELGAISAR